MFEAKLTEGHLLKKIIEAIKDLVTDVNIEVSPAGKCSFPYDLKWYQWAKFDIFLFNLIVEYFLREINSQISIFVQQNLI